MEIQPRRRLSLFGILARAACGIAVGVVIVIVAGVIIGFLWLMGDLPGQFKSDQKLKTQFEKHSVEFSQLRDMMLQDNFDAVSDYCVNDYWLQFGKWREGAATFDESQMLQRVGLSEERYHLYLNLLKEAGAKEVQAWSYFPSKGDKSLPEVRFFVCGRGALDCTEWKGIAYCEYPPDRVVDDTKGFARNEENGEAYVRIRDKWYIEDQW
jgi:hypothetical protein